MSQMPVDESSRMRILRQVERGELDAAAGSRLLAGLDGGAPADQQNSQPDFGPAVQGEVEGNFKSENWTAWKWVPFGLAVLLTVISTVWVYQGWQAREFGLGFWLAWIPFALGVAGMVLTWQMRWLHLRVDTNSSSEKPFSFRLHIPLPLMLFSWALRRFGHYIPGQPLSENDELMAFLDGRPDFYQPIHIDVDSEDGSRVQISIE